MNQQSLHPRSVILFFIQQLIGLIILLPMIFAIFFSVLLDLVGTMIEPGLTSELAFARFLTPFIVVSILLLVYSYIISYLRFYFYRYSLSENGFQKEYGIISKKYVTIPYNKIQNIDISRTLVSRILGLSELQIQTAGAGAHSIGEGRLPGITHATALELRDTLTRLSQ